MEEKATGESETWIATKDKASGEDSKMCEMSDVNIYTKYTLRLLKNSKWVCALYLSGFSFIVRRFVWRPFMISSNCRIRGLYNAFRVGIVNCRRGPGLPIFYGKSFILLVLSVVLGFRYAVFLVGYGNWRRGTKHCSIHCQKSNFDGDFKSDIDRLGIRW